MRPTKKVLFLFGGVEEHLVVLFSLVLVFSCLFWSAAVPLWSALLWYAAAPLR
jgi:hypothetical protein